MKAVTCLVILLALAYCVDGRERLGKIIKRHARHREDKALQSPQTGFIEQSVVRNSFTQPQSQLLTNQPQVSEINVPLSAPAVRQAQYVQAQQQAAQSSFAAQQGYQNPNQPITLPASQSSFAAQQGYQNPNQPITLPASQSSFAAQQGYLNQNQPITSQAAQPSIAAQQGYQYQNQPITSQAAQTSIAAQQGYQYQNQPITSNQLQQGQQASYSEISLHQALKSPKYSQAVQAVQQAYQTSPAWAQPIAMRDETNKILMRLPSNATLIRPYITDGFSCLGRPYGYYADVTNECQIFHVCFPLKSVFNNDPNVPDVTYEFSFICNEFTRFSQDSMTCAWSYEALPCQDSESVYSINDHFFKITTQAPSPSLGPIGGSVVILPGAYPGLG